MPDIDLTDTVLAQLSEHDPGGYIGNDIRGDDDEPIPGRYRIDGYIDIPPLVSAIADALPRPVAVTASSWAELDALPVGTIIRTNHGTTRFEYVCEKLSDGWFTLLHAQQVYPLRTKDPTPGEFVTILFIPGYTTKLEKGTELMVDVNTDDLSQLSDDQLRDRLRGTCSQHEGCLRETKPVRDEIARRAEKGTD